MYRGQSSGVRVYSSQSFRVLYVQRAEFKSALHTEDRVQKYAAYRGKSSGVCYVQRAELRSALCTDSRIKEYAEDRFWSVLCTDCEVQKCAVYRGQSSGVRCVQRTEFRGMLRTVYSSGLCCVQNVEFRSVLCIEGRVQVCAVYKGHSSGVSLHLLRYFTSKNYYSIELSATNFLEQSSTSIHKEQLQLTFCEESRLLLPD